MAARLPERFPRSARLAVLVAVWVAIYLGLVHRLWPVVCLVGIVAILWLFWLERGTAPMRTVPQAILRTAGWLGVSLIGFIVFAFTFLVVATAGAQIGLWGSPWDGR